jgi:hypothetical protein
MTQAGETQPAPAAATRTAVGEGDVGGPAEGEDRWGPGEAFVRVAGLIAVCAGLLAVAGVAVTAMALSSSDPSHVATIATSAIGVIGSVVGAYFGVRVGAAGREKTEAARQAEAARAQTLAAHLDPQTAQSALAQAEATASRVMKAMT